MYSFFFLSFNIFSRYYFIKSANKLNTYTKHPFHMVVPSYWPVVLAVALLGLVLSVLTLLWYTRCVGFPTFLIFLSLICLVLYGWFNEVIYEATFLGYHTDAVQKGIGFGFLLFIVSEIMFFFGFFWAYFHSSLSPAIQIGCVWPPLGIQTFNPWGVPLANTIVLVTSGITITWCHKLMLTSFLKDYWEAYVFLNLTITLGVLFTVLQIYEYNAASFSINDSVYGSCFFLLTGFHGFHVLVGTIFLMVQACRMCKMHFTSTRHLGFLCAAWYWHFVDVVWLGVFILIYWWGS